MTYIINLFGIGIRYWICEVPELMYDEMQQIRSKHKVEWERLLFDFDLLAHFGYSHWSELSNYPEQSGFLLDPQNRIEIKQGAKFIARFRANELTNDTTLFPLYNSGYASLINDTTDIFQRKIMLLQKEQGLIGKYKFQTENFYLDNLRFQLKHVSSFDILQQINYDTTNLQSIDSDSLTISSVVIYETNSESLKPSSHRY